MRAEHSITAVALAVCTLGAAGVAGAAPAKPATFDTAAIEELTGAKGSLDTKEGVFKVSLPRGDIKATVGGVRITPPLGLTAWAAFTKAGKHTMVMGDIVLLEDQVNPVMIPSLQRLPERIFLAAQRDQYSDFSGTTSLQRQPPAIIQTVPAVPLLLKSAAGLRPNRSCISTTRRRAPPG